MLAPKRLKFRKKQRGHFRGVATVVAMLFNAAGTQILLVGPDSRLHAREVIVGRDFGNTLDIQAGLSGEDWVVEQPDVSLQDGQLIIPVEPQHAANDP